MSGSLVPTVAAAPTTTEVVMQTVALMAAMTNIVTDYNVGSNIRTLMEAEGSNIELQGISDQALAFQSFVYGAMNLFNVSQSRAQSATGVATFATSFPLGSAQPVTQAVPIPAGTLIQTLPGVQFSTLTATTLASGTTSINVGVIATQAGAAGNVAASAITGTPLTSIGYPLVVTNLTATNGGANAGTQSAALAQFTAKTASLGLSSPVAVANASIGVAATGTGETVAYAACYEAWLAAGSGAGSGVAGFTLFIDNGTGGASPALIAAVTAWITGSQLTNQSGFRPAGVPFSVSAVTPVFALVGVTGTLIPGLFGSGNVTSTAASGITAYFNSLGISAPPPGGSTPLNAALQPQIAAAVADAGGGAYSALTVNLYYSGSATPQPLVSGGVGTRVILADLSISIG